MEYPHTSKTAQILAWISLGMVLVSTFTFIVSTAEVFQGELGHGIEILQGNENF